MTEDLPIQSLATERDSCCRRHAAVDGLLAGRSEVWVMVARPGEDPADLLWSGEDREGESTVRVCRAVLDDGTLVLATADPEEDPLLSDLMRGEDRGTA